MDLNKRVFMGNKKIPLNNKYRFELPSTFYKNELKDKEIAMWFNYNRVLVDIPCISMIELSNLEQVVSDNRYYSLFHRTKFDSKARIVIKEDIRDHIKISENSPIYLFGENEYISIYNVEDAEKILRYLMETKDLMK